MTSDYFRHLYEYHFAINHKIWDRCIVPLTDEQFKRKIHYSVGSVRNHVIHMLNVDDRWFCALRGLPDPGGLNAVYFNKRDVIRARWDTVEAGMRAYLVDLRDDRLEEQPYLAQDGDPIRAWQVLLHVVNHGTDHRAQLLALLNQLGVATFPQDYAFYIDGKM